MGGRDQIAGALKTFANATSYGINAEMNRLDLPGDATRSVMIYAGDEPTGFELRHPEEPGPFTYP